MADGTEAADCCSVALRLEADIPELVARYETQLRRINSPLLLDDLARAQCLDHARRLIGEVVQALQAGATLPQLGSGVLIGAARAMNGVHPGESLRASGVLFEVIVQHAAQLCPQAAVDVALKVNAVLSRAVTKGAEGYAGAVLERIHRAHVDERRKVGRELHDRVGNGINLAYRSIELFDMYRESQPARALSRLETARQALWDTHQDLREIISDLRVSEPLESLEKAVRGFLETAADPELDAVVELNGDEFWATPDVRDEAYLIIQEALRNVLNHARAKQVMVRIDLAPDELRATVTDDGHGFDPRVRRPRSAGLGTMRERAQGLGGTVTITSEVGQGTRVQLWIPLPSARAAAVDTPDDDE